MNNPIHPGNKESSVGQTAKLFKYLLTGKKIHIYSEDKRNLRLGYLPSRISDLRNKFELYDLVVGVPETGINSDGKKCIYQLYSIPPQNIDPCIAILKHKHPVFYRKVEQEIL
jgi:hypothetical protein